MTGPQAWTIEHHAGSAAAFHGRPLDGRVRTAWVWEVDRPALVLGSAQRAEVADAPACAAAGVEIVHRRSGGGAVLLVPGRVVWVDLELPRDDPWWDDDVGRAAWWVGERWAAALATLGVPTPTVHRGGLIRTEWSDRVCFAGLGPGEVTAGPGGPKVLGVSQRRTRAGARFQCAVPLTGPGGGGPVPGIEALLALGSGERAALAAALAGGVRAVDADGPTVAAALAAALA